MSAVSGFRCRACGKRDTRTVDTRPVGAFSTYRRRRCSCGNRFATYEVDADSYALLGRLRSGALRSSLEMAARVLAEHEDTGRAT